MKTPTWVYDKELDNYQCQIGDFLFHTLGPHKSEGGYSLTIHDMRYKKVRWWPVNEWWPTLEAAQKGAVKWYKQNIRQGGTP